MNYYLDRSIKVVSGEETRSMWTRNWSLTEIAEDGTICESDLVPWGWSTYFHFNDLSLRHSISNSSLLANRSGGPQPVTEQRWMVGALLLGYDEKSRWSEKTRCTFFGCDREVQKIRLCICKLQDGDKDERCEASGVPAGEMDLDFSRERHEDQLDFTLFLTARNFESIAQAIERGNSWSGFLRVTGMQGCYAHDSPSTTTHFVKILAPGCEPKIEAPDALKDIELPKLGVVHEFDLNLTMQRALPRQPEPAESDIDEPAQQAQPPEAEREQTLHNIETLISGLRGQLTRLTWIAAAGLAVVIFLR